MILLKGANKSFPDGNPFLPGSIEYLNNVFAQGMMMAWWHTT